ncbi:MAG: hypothetical protein V3R91_09975 [Myxococcota bacterium]
MRRVLVTHVDSAVGRRIVKALYHDTEVDLLLGTGTGPTPSFLAPYRDKCAYERIDLARARHLSSFFHSERFSAAGIDSIIHLSFCAENERDHIPGNVPSLVSETRRLVGESLEQPGIERFVYLSSAFVYRPEPGSSNVMSESQLLAFEAEGDPEVRAWIDADLICQGELNDPRLKMTILRAATIVTDGGEFVHSPPLERGVEQLGFDPLVSLVADRDVARALVLALHSDRPGIYNIAGREVFPRSELRGRDLRVGPIEIPPLLRGVFSVFQSLLGRGGYGDSGLHRYGVVLDTGLAADILGFEPQYRIEIYGQGKAHRVEPVRYR